MVSYIFTYIFAKNNSMKNKTKIVCKNIEVIGSVNSDIYVNIIDITSVEGGLAQLFTNNIFSVNDIIETLNRHGRYDTYLRSIDKSTYVEALTERDINELLSTIADIYGIQEIENYVRLQKFKNLNQ